MHFYQHAYEKSLTPLFMHVLPMQTLKVILRRILPPGYGKTRLSLPEQVSITSQHPLYTRAWSIRTPQVNLNGYRRHVSRK